MLSTVSILWYAKRRNRAQRLAIETFLANAVLVVENPNNPKSLIIGARPKLCTAVIGGIAPKDVGVDSRWNDVMVSVSFPSLEKTSDKL